MLLLLLRSRLRRIVRATLPALLCPTLLLLSGGQMEDSDLTKM